MESNSSPETDLIYNDTIVAVATPSGRGAIGVVRISGPRTSTLLAEFCHPKTSPGLPLHEYFRANARRQVFCKIILKDDELLDEGLVVFFQAPNSYTGEDSAEISLHGNPLLLRKLIRAFIEKSNVRLASGGEFTRRAFLNGKFDLTQAEAVRRIIEARGEYELKASQKMLAGAFKRQISRLRSALITIKAETEAEIDFSTEDISFSNRTEKLEKIEAVKHHIQDMIKRGENSSRLVAGYQIVLAGKPNAGKSSLLNLILGWDRAIVSPVAGTTRDYISEEIQIDGVAIRIVDTAGLRETQDAMEAEGVRRTHKEIERSQIVLHIIDGSDPELTPEVIDCSGEIIYVINKMDILNPAITLPDSLLRGSLVYTSCKTEEGLDDLKYKIREIIFSGVSLANARDPFYLEERHTNHLKQACSALDKLTELCREDAPPEIQAVELDCALEEIGELTGQVSNEEVLGRIFSLFCIGK